MPPLPCYNAGADAWHTGTVGPTEDPIGKNVNLSRMSFELASTGFSFSIFKRFAELAKKADIIHYLLNPSA